MLIITWVTDEMGRPHATWSSVAADSDLFTNPEIGGRSSAGAPVPSSMRQNRGGRSIALMPRGRQWAQFNN